MTSPLEWMISLVKGSGGVVEDGRFVTRPGCLVLARTGITPEAHALLHTLNIGEGPGYEQLAEVNSRLTYLSFRDAPTSSTPYLNKMGRELQHLSVFAAYHVTFLLAGIGLETSLELIAHREARVARLTSSNTKAMDDPLFRLQGPPEATGRQRKLILDALASRQIRGGLALPLHADEREFLNINHPGSKATAITFTMGLKDYHTLFIGRLPVAGNEVEVREVCGMMCRQLHADYPLVIRSPEEYAGMRNGEKYGS